MDNPEPSEGSLVKRLYKQADMTATPDKYPQKAFSIKGCRWCAEKFQPVAPSHLYCSDYCKDRSYANAYYTKAYGLGIDEVEKLIESQNHRCAICDESGFKMHDGVWTSLNIDHDHTTGVVRGALCHNCNRGLGLFRDKEEILLKAVAYLKGATTIPRGSRTKRSEARDIDG